MATQQGISTSGKKGSSKAAAQASGRKATAGGRASEATSTTGESDDTYGLISVIYHALQGAETCGKYIEDARRAGNQELLDFFEEAREEQNRRALLGRRLLAAELEDVEGEVDEMLEDEDSDR
jgi:hypothetical protein